MLTCEFFSPESFARSDTSSTVGSRLSEEPSTPEWRSGFSDSTVIVAWITPRRP